MKNNDKIIDEAFDNNKEIQKCSKILYLAAQNTTEKGFMKILKAAYSVIDDIIYNNGGDSNE